jgi:hypothetical protein
MGLIMLILIGAAPTAYALNRAIPESSSSMFLQAISKHRTCSGRMRAMRHCPWMPLPRAPWSVAR